MITIHKGLAQLQTELPELHKCLDITDWHIGGGFAINGEGNRCRRYHSRRYRECRSTCRWVGTSWGGELPKLQDVQIIPQGRLESHYN